MGGSSVMEPWGADEGREETWILGCLLLRAHLGSKQIPQRPRRTDLKGISGVEREFLLNCNFYKGKGVA